MPSNRVLVVGAGAAGCMAAITAAQNGAQVLLLDRNAKIGRKLMITGKGRCNVTNMTETLDDLIAQVPGNGRFLYSAFASFMPQDTVDFFSSHGVPLKVERGRRVFPQSDRASDIVDALRRCLSENAVEYKIARVDALLAENGAVSGVRTETGENILADRVILATGGKSYPQTGSTGDGYRLAERVGHTVTALRPSLSALVCREGLCSACMGLSLRNTAIRVYDTVRKKDIYKDFGEMLFTHFGVSGPIILSASAHMREMQPARYEIYIDLKPALSPEKLDARILRDFNENSNKSVANVLALLLPRAMISPVLRLAGIDGFVKVNQITKAQRGKLAQTVKSIRLTVMDFYDIREAIVTAGGVKTSEVDPKTMESKRCKGLYLAGELLDCDAYTGGFNLQIAFATGHLAGISAAAPKQ